MEKYMEIWEGLHELKPGMAMVIVQALYAGVNVLYKLAADDGMKLKVLITYRFLFATAFILPIAFFVESSSSKDVSWSNGAIQDMQSKTKSRPKLTWMILFQAFLCGLFGGSLAQCLYLESLNLTSATFASAMTNLVPAITFILAVSCGLEKLNLGQTRGKAKLLGSLMGIGGAILLALYKGVEIDIWSTHVDLLHHGQQPQQQQEANSNNHVLGSLVAVACCACISLWLIIQAKMSERYPCPYSSTALMSIMASIQTLVFALCTEKDLSQWKLGWNIRLLTVAYAGVVASGIAVVFTAWCVRLRGPLFVSVFNPLMLVLVAIAGSLVLNEKLHLGSVLAAVFIVIGLYLVLWGKGKEMKKKIKQLAPSDDQILINIGDQPAELININAATSSNAQNTPNWSQKDGTN